ncbi:acyl-CoA dehydrogenase family protein [Streptomyces ureilyticus]|uniref:Acyl-CoA/acyl-ACP dehydrogenase n=1 Tax=Streptomyces ureilyticus TaxID=1775131 RepID=A0ABX0E042_9ACTN|nr:acyl-CoA dehydrogenase family protein [Streptomyces ureilyticus]NGO46972.1 acyl-CoA/acyl-ACP dehydrogenase [Streptomyces ureilyticus]
MPPTASVATLVARARAEAADWDRAGELPDSVVAEAARAGLLGVGVPAPHGGSGGTPAELGEVCAHLGGACSALRALVTVQDMVTAAVLRWGTPAQRARWLPPLARGERRAAFAATERGAGTELSAVTASVTEHGEEIEISGHKRWVTFGRTADTFLVLGTADGRPAAVLVEGDRPGVRREPVEGQLGLRAAAVAHVALDRVRVPRDHLLAPVGLGLSHVVATALDHGRFTVAWGCVGMAEAVLDAAAEHAARRTQAGAVLAEHEVVRALLGRCAVDTAAARELCARAAHARAERLPEAVADTVVAKYAAARAAVRVTGGAVQTLGAAGCAPDSLVGRFFRDAKVMELIEGSAHVAELHIADRLLRRHGFNSAAHVARREARA